MGARAPQPRETVPTPRRAAGGWCCLPGLLRAAENFSRAGRGQRVPGGGKHAHNQIQASTGADTYMGKHIETKLIGAVQNC